MEQGSKVAKSSEKHISAFMIIIAPSHLGITAVRLKFTEPMTVKWIESGLFQMH